MQTFFGNKRGLTKTSAAAYASKAVFVDNQTATGAVVVQRPLGSACDCPGGLVMSSKGRVGEDRGCSER